MRWTFLLLAIGLTQVAFGQKEEVQFIPINETLSQNTITSILQDDKGFLWLGTRNGLNKYDGVNVHFYDSDNKGANLSNIYVKDIFQDKEGLIWVASYGAGLFVYNERKDSFLQYVHDPEDLNSISDNRVSNIYQDHDGQIWIGTEEGGLNLFDSKEKKFRHYKHNSNDPLSISSNYVTDVEEDDQGNLWVATWGGGLNLLDKNAQRFIHYNQENQENLGSDDINELVKGKDGIIWVATQNGLNRLSYEGKGTFRLIPEQIDAQNKKVRSKVILSVLEKEGQLWVGTENGGLIKKELATGAVNIFEFNPKDEYSIQSNSIWSLFEDKTGIVWVGTFNKGLFKVDPDHRKFNHIKQNPYDAFGLSDNTISAFVEDEKGNLWIGTDGGGLNYWDKSTGIFEKYRHDPENKNSLSSDAVLSLMLDENNDLWVGTWQGGIMIKRSGSKTFEPFELGIVRSDKRYKGNIFSIFKDSKGRVWIAAFRDGVFVYHPDTKKIVHLQYEANNPRSINTNLARNFIEDEQGTIWIGTEGGGLNRCIEQNGSFYFDHYTYDAENEKSLMNNIIISLIQDSDGDMWVGSSGGLHRFNKITNEFTKIGKAQGLPNEVINGILEGNPNELWISTNKGLSRWNKNNGEVRNYDDSDGLQSLEFSKNAYYKTKAGLLCFGGINGFNIFDPKNIRDNPNTSPVYITEFRLNNKIVKPGVDSPLKESITTTSSIQLEHDQSDISFQFAILNFSRSEKCTYAYQLVNYDEDWQEVGTRRSAYYTNVPPGFYTFKVKATNSDGLWNPEIAELKIEISPPWYKTYWAYSLFIIAFTGLLVLGIQTIVNRERLQNQIKIDTIELSKMQEVDQVKSRFFANISHEFRSPLTLILGPLKAMAENPGLEQHKKQIDLMVRNSNRLLTLINQLLELSKIEAGHMKLETSQMDLVKFLKPIIHSFSPLVNKKYLSYQVQLPKEPLPLYFDKEKVEKIVINLISNAIKYTPEFGKISIKLFQENLYAVFEVEDNGVGIPKEEIEFVFNRYYRVNSKKGSSSGTGIGLSLTKELVNLHSGEITLDSKENEGAVFRVKLPLGKGHLLPEQIVASSQEHEFDPENYERESLVLGSKENENEEQFDEEKESEGFPIVLVIDDNQEIREYVCDILKDKYRVLQADNGTDGLEMAKESIPDLIISDIMMPGLDGYELCRKVKTDVKTSHIPVVLLTAKASNDSTLTGFEMGADYFIIKPFNPKILLLRVRNVLKSRNSVKENLLNKETLNLEPKNVKINAKDEDFLKKAIEVVEHNMSNSNFYVDDLGKELGLSRMQLYRKLKGLIGQSANEFTRSIRLKRAAQLIEQNTLTISEITYEVGFSDLQYFRDCFKKQFGVNPTEYLKNSQKKAV